MSRPVRSGQIAHACAICSAALVVLASAAFAHPATLRAASAADSEAPRGAVGGFASPVRGTLRLTVSAVDGGAGLATATASVDGQLAGQVRLGAPSCGAPSGAEPPAGACPPSVSAIALVVDLAPYAAGRHRLEVRVADAAGNVSLILDETIEIAGPPPVQTPSASLQIGDGGAPAGGGGAPSGTPQPAPLCLAPRLSIVLDQRPLRTTRAGVPVLRRGAHYRFRGRLTCRVGSGRRSAPAGAPVLLVNRFGPGGRRVLSKTGLVTRRAGRLTLVVAYRSSRIMTFRYVSADGTTSRVQISVIVAKARSTAGTAR